MKAHIKECNRRTFLTGSALGALGLIAMQALPQTAYAETTAMPTPVVNVVLKKENGQLLDVAGTMERTTAGDQTLCISKTEKSTIENSDGTYTAQCATAFARSAGTSKQESYEDEFAAATVTINYTFYRGMITVTSGSVEITNIASNVEMYSRYLIVAQGPYTGTGDSIIEEFTGNSHTIITNFESTEYIPSGAVNMNICRFESGIYIDGTEDYFFDVEVTV